MSIQRVEDVSHLDAVPIDSEGTALRLYTSTHPAMGTEYSIYLYANSSDEAEAKATPAFDEIDRIDGLLSNYRDDSELSRINREAAAGAVTTDPEVFRFLDAALKWSEKSGGAFDMTVGGLMKTWGFFGAEGRVPSDAEIAEARGLVGWGKVILDPERRTVRFLSDGIEFDPGGIGKGYAVDRAVRILRRNGIQRAMVSSGGSTIYALGSPDGEAGWKIQVPMPGDEEATASTVILRDMSLSTANRSQKNFVEDGHLYGSIMDPRSLRPAEGVLQVTAIAPSALDSDVLSNALFILCPDEGAKLIDDLPESSALIFTDKQPLQYKSIRWPAVVAARHPLNQPNTN